VPNYFEDAAKIAEAGGLDWEQFTDNFDGVAIVCWKIWDLAVMELQEEDPLAYEEFEKLANDAIARDAAREAPNASALASGS
jgi:hypothetical protein